MQRDQIDTLNALNAEHLRSRPGYSELQARIASYELAFQLQSTAPEVDGPVAAKTPARMEMYGLNEPKADAPPAGLRPGARSAGSA